MQVTVRVLEAKRVDAKKWSVRVELAFFNDGAKTFALDKVSACEGGAPQNSVFEVKASDKAVEYRGEMRKRAHPGRGGFHKVKAGETLALEVQLGEHFAFPAAGGALTLRFDSFNHFSTDAVQLTSAEVPLLLR